MPDWRTLIETACAPDVRPVFRPGLKSAQLDALNEALPFRLPHDLDALLRVTDGVQTVKANGGVVIAQDKATSEQWSMPESALKSGAVDYVLPLEAIGPAIEAIVNGRPVAGAVGAT